MAFDPAPALNSASAMTAHDAMMRPSGAIHNASITAPDALGYMAELQLNVQGQAPEGGGGNAPSHGHGNTGSEINPIVALNNDENLGVPEASGKHGPAVASPVENSGEPPPTATIIRSQATQANTATHHLTAMGSLVLK